MAQHFEPHAGTTTEKESTRSKERSKSAKEADAEVLRLLEAMGRAVTAGDGEAVAGLWETPAFVLGDSMVKVVGSSDELAKFFSGAKGEYNSRGITDTYPEIMRLDWLTQRLAVVSVRWPYLDKQGNERGYETSTYTLRRDDEGNLKLRVAVMHGAREAD